jgi:hypothetical protein
MFVRMTKIKTLLLLACGFCLLVACGKKEDVRLQLPEATQTGANTFGFMADDRMFKVQWDVSGNANANPNGIVDVNGFFVHHQAGRPVLSFGNSILYLDFPWKGKTGTYPLGGKSSNNVCFFLDHELKKVRGLGSHIFETDAIHTGEVVITRYDNNVLAGTFWFNAANDSGRVVRIRDGRFDIDLQP